MKKLYTIFCLAICLFISGQSMAQINNIGGTITTDTTWMDTVNVTSDIYLPDSVTLTIQAGTVIDFDSACMISVDGSIMAIGSVNDSITFTADSTGFGTLSHYGWKGIDIDDPASGDSSIFAYCRFFYFNGEYGYACIHTYDFSEMIVENCRFSYNYNYQETTCIHIEYEGNSIIRNNLFTYNYSDRSCIQLGCGSGNEPNTTILNNTFMYNEGYDEGACLKISAYSNAKAINNVFRYNYCEGYGCAIDITGYATPTIIGNLISDNYSTYYGGGVSIKYYANPRLINNTIVNNYAEDGGGIQIGCYTTSPYFENNIIWGNEALYEGDQLYCYDDGTSGYTFINNIIQGGIDSIYFDEPPFGGVDINTINTSPMFVDSANGDYHLTCLSPAIDAGSNPTIMMPPVDLDGNQRLIGSNYDIGVYEMLAAAVILSHPQNTQVMTGTVANFTVNTNYSTAFQWEESTDFG
ncbi:MAG: hypothetical protein C0592_04060 [Marinilabiliales bacterium]|nr:MAG: hypothetical protein C0592_04060 [Marinilabiliales bacterium]